MADAVIPARLEVPAGTNLTPNEMRLVAAQSGRTETELFSGDFPSLTIQAVIWATLRRSGVEASWDDAGDVVPVSVEAPPDPTNGAASPTSPPSAASGG